MEMFLIVKKNPIGILIGIVLIDQYNKFEES